MIFLPFYELEYRLFGLVNKGSFRFNILLRWSLLVHCRDTGSTYQGVLIRPITWNSIECIFSSLIFFALLIIKNLDFVKIFSQHSVFSCSLVVQQSLSIRIFLQVHSTWQTPYHLSQFSTYPWQFPYTKWT